MFGFLNPFSRSIKTYHFQFHDGGRQAAGFKGGAGDCVVRSIAIAANLPYLQVYDHRNVFHDYILGLGFEWVATMKIGSGCQVHMRNDELPQGTLIVKVSKHLTVIKDGVILDTHDPSRAGNRCVYGYYIKK